MRGELSAEPENQPALCEVLDRVLNKGVVLAGCATVSVAGVDLLYLGLQIVLSSTDTLQRKPL